MLYKTWMKTLVRIGLASVMFVSIMSFGVDSVRAKNPAFFSVKGRFSADPSTMSQELQFGFIRNVDSTETSFGARTYSYSGGTNLAGDVIPGGGFDPMLTLEAASGVPLGSNRNGFPFPDRDAYLSWSDLMSDPLFPGNYQINMSFDEHSLLPTDRHWAVDLTGPADAMVFTGSHSSPGASLDAESLKFGSLGCTNGMICVPEPAKFMPHAGQHSIQTLHVAEYGYAEMTIGAGVHLTADQLNVGVGNIVGASSFANGSLLVEAGGVLDSRGAGELSNNIFRDVIGQRSGTHGTAVVRDADSKMMFDNLVVGEHGIGQLEVLSGAMATSRDTWIGRNAGSAGSRVHVSGPDSIWRLDELSVGQGADSSLVVAQGGFVEAASEIVVHKRGRIELHDAATSSSVLDLVGGALLGQGTINVSDSLGVSNDGLISPGLHLGSISILGNYRQRASGILDIEVGGTSSIHQYDRLIVTGAVTLDGQLNVTMDPAYSPTAGSVELITIVDSNGGRQGNFVTEPNRDQGGGLFVDVIYNPDDVQLSLLQAMPGDANGDGEFNTADLVQIFAAGKYDAGKMANWSQGDWNQDGLFDSQDLVAAFQTGLFETGPYIRSVQSVPEPTSLTMIGIGLITGCCWSRRQRRRSTGCRNSRGQ